jgi:hypothetical protein
MKKIHKAHTHRQEELEHGYDVSHKSKKGGKKTKRAMHGHFEQKRGLEKTA